MADLTAIAELCLSFIMIATTVMSLSDKVTNKITKLHHTGD